MNYTGTIIEESLSDKSVLDQVKILDTKVALVTEKSKTPWVKQWTKHTVEVGEEQADRFAESLSQAIEFEHQSSWYADFWNERTHYIVFKDKIFKLDRKSKEQYDEAYQYGLSAGIPPYQLRTFETHKLRT